MSMCWAEVKLDDITYLKAGEADKKGVYPSRHRLYDPRTHIPL